MQSTIDENKSNNKELLEVIRKFNDNFSKLQSELAATKQVNTELTKRIVTLECQSWANAQYSRKECWNTSPSGRQPAGNKSTFNFREGWLRN